MGQAVSARIDGFEAINNTSQEREIFLLKRRVTALERENEMIRDATIAQQQQVCKFLSHTKTATAIASKFEQLWRSEELSKKKAFAELQQYRESIENAGPDPELLKLRFVLETKVQGRCIEEDDALIRKMGGV